MVVSHHVGRCWVSNLGRLQEQHVLLTSKSSTCSEVLTLTLSHPTLMFNYSLLSPFLQAFRTFVFLAYVCMFTWCVHVNLELANSASLVSQQVPRILPSPPPQHRD